MAADTVGLMVALAIQSAHVVGMSMGGMIAQEIAISFPQRLRSLTSIMSTTGDPAIPPPTREVAAMLRRGHRPRARNICALRADLEDAAGRQLRDRSRAERTFARGINPAGVGRQLRAVLASGSRKQRLRAVKTPTLVIHGTVDPLVHPAGGKDTAASIAGAKLLMIEGMGHALPIRCGRRSSTPSTATPMRRRRRLCSDLSCHSGAMRSIEPGISRLRVWSFGPFRNDDTYKRFDRNGGLRDVPFTRTASCAIRSAWR